MPEQLKVHPGERVDLVDYVHGANTYTQEMQKFLLERTMLDRRARVLDGFRIRVEDQTLNPGMVTVFNGNALDRDGQLINNEQTINDSRSITLLGANTNFYVEIEFIDVESSTDARFFWDPTIPNTPPEPDGSEFSLNVATRLTPDWRIVTPVSTTGFEQATNPNSTRIPVGVFRTNGANQIVAGADNPGLVLVRPSSTLEVDVALGASTLRVVDARIYPATFPFNITVDVGGSTPEARVVTSVDRENGLLDISVPLAADHSAGAIVQVTSGTADLVRENTDPSDPALDPTLAIPGHPDAAQRLWQANEVRGSALITSKETFGSRDDVAIRSLKDEIDALSALVRELKFGSPRPEVVNTAPPSTFATRPRWFDRAGSVTGARTNSVSIGNGTTTFGDFNGTDGDVVFTAALAALPASGGTIFVKGGTYVFSAAVNVTKTVTIVGEGFGSTILSNQNAAGEMLTLNAATTFENITLQVGGGGDVDILRVASAVSVGFNVAVFTGRLQLDGVNAAVRAYRTTFSASGANAIFATINGAALFDSQFFSCSFTAASSAVFAVSAIGVVVSGCSGTAAGLFSASGADFMYNVFISDSYFMIGNFVMFASTTGVVGNIGVDNCNFSVTNLVAGTAAFLLVQSGSNISGFSITNTRVGVSGGTTVTASPGYVVFIGTDGTGELRGFRVDNCDFSGYSAGFIEGIWLDVDELADVASVTNTYFYVIRHAVTLGGATAGLSGGNFLMDGCIHDNAYTHEGNVSGVRYGNAGGNVDTLKIVNCVFKNYASSAGAAGSRIGIDLNNNTSLSASTVIVEGNSFVNLSGTVSNAAYGVRWDVSVASTVPRVFKIVNNEFYIICANNSGTSAAVYLYNASGTRNVQADVSHNRIDTIGEYPGITSGITYGIYVRGNDGSSARTVISHNQIHGVTTSGAAAPASGIEVADSNHVIISNNIVGDVNAVAATRGSAGACIRVADGSGATITNLIVADNICDQSLSSTPTEAEYCIVVNPSLINGFHIDRNICRTSTSCAVGLLVSGNSAAGAGLVRGTVNSNAVAYRDTAAAFIGVGLSVTLGGASYGVAVDGNVVEETTYNAVASLVHVGINVSGNNVGGTTRAVSVSNNIVLGPKSGAFVSAATRRGIRVDGIQRTKVVGNLVDWNEPGVLGGIGIRLSSEGAYTVSGHLVTGNFVRGDNSTVAGGEIDIDTAVVINGLLDSNQVGDGAGAAGTIVPAGATGGWTYGMNKPT